jgi:hypothetical protein
MDAAGVPFLKVDDDTVCQPRSFESLPGIALSSHSGPVRVLVFANAEDLQSRFPSTPGVSAGPDFHRGDSPGCCSPVQR